MARFDRLTVLAEMLNSGLVPIFYDGDSEVSAEVVLACARGGARVIEFTETDTILELVTTAFRYAGGEAVYAANPIQRCWRDLNTAAQHFLVSESAFENHGRFLLGRDDARPFG